MQVIYIMGVFMFIFAVIMGLTTTLSRTAMQAKLDNIAEVRQMFNDVEGGINNGVLANQADLRLLNGNFRNGVSDRFTAAADSARDNFYYGRTVAGVRYPGLLDYISWSEDQLVTDPWGTDIRVYYSTRHVLVDNGVQAPQTIFAYVSAGPDRAFDVANTALDFNQISGLEVPADSDDIISVFSTYGAMIKTWESALKALYALKGGIEKDYSEQYVRFLPWIEVFNTEQFEAGGFSFDNLSLNAWASDATLWVEHRPSATSSSAGTITQDYPVIVQDTSSMAALGLGDSLNDLGFADYLGAVPTFGINSFANFVAISPYGGTLRLRTDRTRLRVGISDSSTGWNVNHIIEIDGRTIISN
ncbi:MAG: hypothetical protein OSB62_07945 [Alphaproteobacteria bacterium]|nr:hypothetical protein [Alphaproteobacteria bacterium]